MGQEAEVAPFRRWSLILAGAFASSFVGTLYGYSYLKGDIGDYWKSTAKTPDELAAYDNYVNTAYSAGFFGQYLAIIPGWVCDLAGPAVTCWYGGLLCFLGFSMVGFGAQGFEVGKPLPILLICGIFLAGQGSKGLGFGSLLGTIRMTPDSWAPIISGVYLMLDALSAVACMLSYDALFGPAEGQTFDLEEHTAPALKNFFCGLGVTIGCVGLASGFAYFVMMKEPEEPADEDMEQGIMQDPHEAGRSRSSMRRASARSSQWEEAVATSVYVGYNGRKSNFDLESEVQSEGGEGGERGTFWLGVVCCCLVMMMSEAQGLAFNNLIGDSYMAARRMKVGAIYFKDLEQMGKDSHHKYSYPSVLNDLAGADVLPTADGKAIREMVETQYRMDKIPARLQISKPDNEKNYAHSEREEPAVRLTFTAEDGSQERVQMIYESDLGDDSGMWAKTWKEEEKVLDCATPIPDGKRAVVVKDFMDTRMPMNLFTTFYQNQCSFSDNALAKAIKKAMRNLTPLAGVQVRDQDKIRYVLHSSGYKHTFNTDGDARKEFVHITGTTDDAGYHPIQLANANTVPQLFRDGSYHADKTPKKKVGAEPEKEIKDSPQVQTFFQFHYPMLSSSHKAEVGFDTNEPEKRDAGISFKTADDKIVTTKVADLPFVKWAVGFDTRSNDGKLEIAPKFHGTSSNPSISQYWIHVHEKQPIYFDASRLAQVNTKENPGNDILVCEMSDSGNFCNEIHLNGGADRVMIPDDKKITLKVDPSVTEARNHPDRPQWKKVFEKLREDNKDQQIEAEAGVNRPLGTFRFAILQKKDDKHYEYKVEGVHSHKSAMKETKRYLAITFSVGNAIGRLGLGIVSGLIESVTPWAPVATWLPIGCVSYIVMFSLFGMMSMPSTHEDPQNVATPMSLFVMAAIVALTYGGVFTINTAYMKKVVAPTQIGLVLGLSLVVLAAGSMGFGSLPGKFFKRFEFVDSPEDVSETLKQPFFISGIILQCVALFPAMICWFTQAKQTAEDRMAEAALEDEASALLNSDD